MRRSLGTCARAASAQATPEPLSKPINSRRLIAPRMLNKASYRSKLEHWKGVQNASTAMGPCLLYPESDIKCDVRGCPLRANSGHSLFIRSLTLGDHQHSDKSSIVYRT